MKRFIFSIFTVLAVAVSCEKDGEMLKVTSPGQPSGFGAGATEIVLSSSQADALALSLFWNAGSMPEVSDPTVGLPDGLTEHSIQFSGSEDFSSYVEMFLEPEQEGLQFTGAELSQLLMKLGMTEVQQYDVYARLAVSMGGVYTYSVVLALKITPYAVETGWMKIVDKNDMNTVLATLRCKEATPAIYEGFAVPATGWYNCFFVAADGTVWGCDSDWTAFSLAAGTGNNCWFAEPSGCQYVYADTGNGLWWHVDVPAVDAAVDGVPFELKYSKSAGGYRGTITTSADNAAVSVTGTGARFDITTGTDGGTVGIAYPFSLVPSGLDSFEFISGESPDAVFTVEKAGTYTLTFNVEDYRWTLTSGEPDEPVVTYPENVSVYYYLKEGSEKLALACEMAMTSTDGVFEGFVYTDPDWSADWSNFRFVADGTVYGTSDQFNLSESGWNIWSSNTGMNYVTVDFSSMAWSETKVSQVAVTGDFNGWSLDADLFTFDLETGKWVVECDIEDMGWGFKFVLGDSDNAWRWMYADTDLDGTLDLAGGNDNIVLSQGGRFRIELDLSNFTSPSYTIASIE